MSTLEKLGNKIKEIRKEKKINQLQLSKLSGLDRSYISNIERAQVNCSILNLEKLAQGLGVEVKDLF